MGKDFKFSLGQHLAADFKRRRFLQSLGAGAALAGTSSLFGTSLMVEARAAEEPKRGGSIKWGQIVPIFKFNINMKKLNIIEKISLIWTIPISMVAIITISISTLIIYIFKIVLVYSGTAGSLQYLFDQIRKQNIKKQWSKIRKNDFIQSQFEKNI